MRAGRTSNTSDITANQVQFGILCAQTHRRGFDDTQIENGARTKIAERWGSTLHGRVMRRPPRPQVAGIQCDRSLSPVNVDVEKELPGLVSASCPRAEPRTRRTRASVAQRLRHMVGFPSGCDGWMVFGS